MLTTDIEFLCIWKGFAQQGIHAARNIGPGDIVPLNLIWGIYVLKQKWQRKGHFIPIYT
jgi:hypothetical protein